MDWNSPPTKKHIAEAEAQGCKLLGPGRNRFHRTYQLPCGHEREIQPSQMRHGKVVCQICFDLKLKSEAKAQGCELLGEGKNANYRMYRLPCGHEREITISSMRNGGFRCKTCLNQKLSQEAVAKGCELLGAGNHTANRTYKLPCGHTQQIQTTQMRKGNFRCIKCFKERLNAEANAQGCRLLGPGSNANNRTYRLSCGHEKEVSLSSMRSGAILCRTCLDTRLRDEAKAQGCELVSKGRSRAYRTYRLPCGHVLEVQTKSMRTGEFQCQTCIDERHDQEAKAQGCELLGPADRKGYCTYRLPCGHKQIIYTVWMRRGGFRCQACLDEKLNEEAKVRGCKLVGPGSNSASRTYLLACGHEKDVGTGQMRAGTFRCKICYDDKLMEEAKAQDCVLLGSSENLNYRLYRLPCGHEQQIKMEHMSSGSFRCQKCEEYSYTQPSKAYLLHIQVGVDEWLKLGYAKNVDLRIKQYGLPLDAVISKLATLPFDTGMKAMEFEVALHKKYKRKRLRIKDMLNFHTGSGATECYPLTMVDKLMSEMKADSK